MKQLTANDTPLKIVEKYRFKYPKHADFYATMAADKERLQQDYPDFFRDWSKMPISIPINRLAVDGYGYTEAAKDAAITAACYLWRQHKIVYDFDPTLAEVLAKQADNLTELEKLPVQFLLQNMPYPCIYIRSQMIAPKTAGAFVWFEYDHKTEAPELRVTLVSDDMSDLTNLCLNLVNDGNLGDCFKETTEYGLKYTEQKTLEKHKKEILRTEAESTAKLLDIYGETGSPMGSVLIALQMLLYIESANSEQEDNPEQRKVYRKPSPTTPIRDKFREVRQVDVGVHVGSALRNARSGGSTGQGSGGAGGEKSAHVRRGHWHGYWTGPRDGARVLQIQWTAPTIIHPDKFENTTPQVVPVKKEEKRNANEH